MLPLHLMDTGVLNMMHGAAVASFDLGESSLKASQHVENGRAERWKGSVWIEMCPLKKYAEVLTPVPQTMTLFGNSVIADVIS